MITLLERLAREYVFERAKKFAGNELGKLVRHDLAIEAKKRLILLPHDLKVKASVGAGNWASVPWLGFFDPIITESATSGFYVVYLINAQTEEIFLSLNQGTTAVYREFGERNGRKILQRRAQDILERVPTFAEHFEKTPIRLGSPESLPLGYEAGHAFGRKYLAGSIDAATFYSDFEHMLAAYRELINLGGTTPIDTMIEETGLHDIDETRRFFLARRVERSPSVRVPVLASRGAICEGCRMDPKVHYSYDGPLKNTPLDVHHSAPLSQLQEGETRRYRIPEDFLVLCPTCHRMIHKQANPADLEALRNTVGFILAPKRPDRLF